MAGEPIMKRQEADETDAPKFEKIIREKTLPTSSDEDVVFKGEEAFLNEDSSTKKTEEEASQNDEEQNGEPEN